MSSDWLALAVGSGLVGELGPVHEEQHNKCLSKLGVPHALSLCLHSLFKSFKESETAGPRSVDSAHWTSSLLTKMFSRSDENLICRSHGLILKCGGWN